MVTHAIYKSTEIDGRDLFHFPEEVELREGRAYLKKMVKKLILYPLQKCQNRKIMLSTL